MVLTIIESPYAGDIERNKLYLTPLHPRQLSRCDEIPFASHAFYTQFLDDPRDRQRVARYCTRLRFLGIRQNHRLLHRLRHDHGHAGSARPLRDSTNDTNFAPIGKNDAQDPH